MLEAIITSVITGGLTLLGVIYSTRKQHDITIQEVKTEIQLVKKDIMTLDTNVKKHNGLVERMYKAESDIKLLEEKQDVANHRIKDLEQNSNEVA